MGLNLATSIAFANGGVVVGQAPHMLFFKDTNGDDKADERKILFTGWPRNDTHGTISNLRYGLRQPGLGLGRLQRLPRHGRHDDVSIAATDSARATSVSRRTFRRSITSRARATTRGASRSPKTATSSARRRTAGRATSCTSRCATTAAWRRRRRCCRPSPTGWTSSRSARSSRSTSSACTRRARRTRSTRRVRSPRSTGTEIAFVAEPTAHVIGMFELSDERLELPREEPLELHGEPRRVGGAGAGEGRSRRRGLGLRLLHAGRAAQPDAAEHVGDVLQTGAGQGVRDAEPRQAARPHLPHRATTARRAHAPMRLDNATPAQLVARARATTTCSGA